MLVLTRKAKQQIQIGPYVTITILQIKGQSVRVGIEAPKDVCVLRTELAEMLAGQEQASGGLGSTVLAALEKVDREAEINSDPASEKNSGRDNSASGSLRCRALRVDVAPVNSPYQSTGPASFLRPRRRRLMMK